MALRLERPRFSERKQKMHKSSDMFFSGLRNTSVCTCCLKHRLVHLIVFFFFFLFLLTAWFRGYWNQWKASLFISVFELDCEHHLWKTIMQHLHLQTNNWTQGTTLDFHSVPESGAYLRSHMRPSLICKQDQKWSLSFLIAKTYQGL